MYEAWPQRRTVIRKASPATRVMALRVERLAGADHSTAKAAELVDDLHPHRWKLLGYYLTPLVEHALRKASADTPALLAEIDQQQSPRWSSASPTRGTSTGSEPSTVVHPRNGR